MQRIPYTLIYADILSDARRYFIEGVPRST